MSNCGGEQSHFIVCACVCVCVCLCVHVFVCMCLCVRVFVCVHFLTDMVHKAHSFFVDM